MQGQHASVPVLEKNAFGPKKRPDRGDERRMRKEQGNTVGNDVGHNFENKTSGHPPVRTHSPLSSSPPPPPPPSLLTEADRLTPALELRKNQEKEERWYPKDVVPAGGTPFYSKVVLRCKWNSETLLILPSSPLPSLPRSLAPSLACSLFLPLLPHCLLTGAVVERVSLVREGEDADGPGGRFARAFSASRYHQLLVLPHARPLSLQGGDGAGRGVGVLQGQQNDGEDDEQVPEVLKPPARGQQGTAGRRLLVHLGPGPEQATTSRGNDGGEGGGGKEESRTGGGRKEVTAAFLVQVRVRPADLPQRGELEILAVSDELDVLVFLVSLCHGVSDESPGVVGDL
eukprot:766757-Hanusia_phi.AAC.2